MAESTPRVLNERYEIHRRLARGGMAQVYLARDRSLDRPVAVKELVPEFATDPSFVERFRREAQAAANLSHPNIVGVYDWGAQDGTYFIVMEYIDGPSLSRVLRQDGPLHPRRAAEIASEVAAGLGFAHSRGVVHRDVKPGNVLLTRSGQAKVTDFGIARALSSADEELTQAGSVMGTATYFSPEQAQGLPVDPRSDLYSLGVVLYELVTGRPPFTGDSPLAIAYKHVQDDPVPPSSNMSGLDHGLEAVILKLLSKRPDDRYSSAEDLRADLHRYLAGEATLAERGLVAAGVAAAAVADPPTTVQPATGVGAAVPPDDPDEPAEDDAGGGGSRTKWFVALLVLLLLLLAGGLVWFASSLSGGDLVTVPPLVGLEVEEAEAQLRELDLEPRVETEPSDEFRAGLVMSQDPDPDAEVETGSTVELVVSAGPDVVEVPNVFLMSEADAIAALEEVGLEAISEPREIDEGEPGIVVEQDPAAGAELSRGDPVRIFVSVLSDTVSVPDVIGRPLAQAEALLAERGLRVGSTSETASNSVPAGSVVSTDPGAGQSVERDSAVDLAVSTGPEQVQVPNVVGQTEESAQNQLTGRGLQVTVSPQSVPAGDANAGRVISQDPSAGESVDVGTSVEIAVGVPTPTTTTTSSTTTSSTTTTAP